MTHLQRANRRQRIAQAVRRGATIAEASQEFCVSFRTVQQSCRENGVEYPKAPPIPTSMTKVGIFPILARLCNSSTRLHLIARELGVTAQRVGHIYRGCLAAGVPVQVRAKAGAA